jgi:hypothetical protein
MQWCFSRRTAGMDGLQCSICGFAEVQRKSAADSWITPGRRRYLGRNNNVIVVYVYIQRPGIWLPVTVACTSEITITVQHPNTVKDVRLYRLMVTQKIPGSDKLCEYWVFLMYERHVDSWMQWSMAPSSPRYLHMEQAWQEYLTVGNALSNMGPILRND